MPRHLDVIAFDFDDCLLGGPMQAHLLYNKERFFFCCFLFQTLFMYSYMLYYFYMSKTIQKITQVQNNKNDFFAFECDFIFQS